MYNAICWFLEWTKILWCIIKRTRTSCTFLSRVKCCVAALSNRFILLSDFNMKICSHIFYRPKISVWDLGHKYLHVKMLIACVRALGMLWGSNVFPALPWRHQAGRTPCFSFHIYLISAFLLVYNKTTTLFAIPNRNMRMEKLRSVTFYNVFQAESVCNALTQSGYFYHAILWA